MRASPRVLRALRLLAGWLPLAGACCSAFAEPTPPAGPDVRELWVPSRNLAEALKSSPRAIVLTADQFDRLLRDSLPRPVADAAAPPVPAVLTEARYEGRAGDRFATFRAEFTVECLTDSWTQVPLALQPRWLGAVKVDGESALQVSGGNGGDGGSAEGAQGEDRSYKANRSYTTNDTQAPVSSAAAAVGNDGRATDAATRTMLTVRGIGKHSLSVDFALPVEDVAGQRGITLPAPGSAGARLTLELPEALKLESSAPFTRQRDRAEFALPPGPGGVRIAWTARDLAPLETGALFQECRMRYSPDPAGLMADLALTWHSPLRPLPAQLVLPLPPDAAVLRAEGPELRRWTLAGDKLVVDFTPEERKSAALHLVLDRALTLPENGGPLKLTLPAPVAEGVFRTSGQFSLIPSDDLRVRSVTAGPLAERDDSRNPADAGGTVFGTWFFPVLPQPPEVELQRLRVQFAATLDTQVSLTRDAVRLTRWLSLTPRDGTLFSPRLEGLAAGEEIESVTTSDGRETLWKKTEAGLVFPGNEGLAAGKIWTVMVKTRLDPPGWQSMTEQALNLSLTSAKVPGAGKVNGYVALEFDSAQQVLAQAAPGLEPRDPSQFAGTLPLRGQLAWSRLEDFQLNLTVSRRAPEYDASVVFYALPLLNGLEVEGALTLAIERSPLRELRVIFPPAAAPSVRWDSPLLAESFLEPDNSWRLRFHQETDGRPVLRFRLSMPLTDATEAGAPGTGTAANGAPAAPERRFTVAAPVLSVPGARRLTGAMVVEANTDTELSFTASGLNALDTLQAPAIPGYRPSHRLVSAWTWPGGKPALTISGVRHKPGALVSTVIDRLELDTVVSAEGPLRHQARVELRTAGEQYLDLTLPPDARVLTLLVNDAATKPVRNRQGGLRVPLPGPVAVIRLICECPGSALTSADTAKLTPVTPDPALPVLETQWRLHLPEGFSYSQFDSNLTKSKTARPPAETPAVLAVAVEEFNFMHAYYGRILPGSHARHQKRAVAAERARNTQELAVLEAKIKEQEAETQEARGEVLRLMKLNGIIDTSLMGDSSGATPFVGTSNNLYMQSKEQELNMATQVAKFKANLEGLSRLSGEALIEGAMSYGVEDDTIKQYSAEWKRNRVEYERLTTSGFSAQHPSVVALAETIAKQRQVLMDAAENYKSTLAINIQNLERALASAETSKADRLQEKTESAEYFARKQEWEQKLDMLNKLRGMETRTKSEQDQLRGLPDDQAYALLEKMRDNAEGAEFLPGGGGGKSASAKPAGPGSSELETQTFDVPADFLAKGAAPEAGEGKAGPADPFTKRGVEGSSALASRPTARSILTQMGLEFGEGATATFSADTGKLVVRNTRDQLAAAQALLGKQPTLTGDFDSGISSTVGIHALDREGILPLDFALPKGGIVYQFEGQYPPEALSFRYQSWQGQVRWSWLWILAGALGFRLLGWRSPWFYGFVGALALQFAPGILGRTDWLPVVNALVIGWVGAALLRVVARRFFRARPQQAGPVAPPHALAGSPQVLTLLLILSLASVSFILSPSTARAQEAPPAAGAVPEAVPEVSATKASAATGQSAVQEPPVVIIPFDPANPPGADSKAKRYLDYATFQRLWTAAKANRLQEAGSAGQDGDAGRGERAAILTSALHRAEAVGQVLRVESVYALLTRGPDWAEAPFLVESGLKSLALDGAPAALKEGRLLVEKAGAHQVTAVFEVPLPAGWQEVSWKVPAATAASLALSLAMDDSARPVINDGAPLVETEDAGRRVFTAPLGAASVISLKRLTSAKRAGGQAAEPSLAVVNARIFLSPALERVEAEIRYQFAGEERSEFTLRLDPGLTPVSFSVPGLENWTMRREPDAQVLDFRLSRPAREFFAMNLLAERPTGALPLTESAPLVSAGAGRVERSWSLLATGDVEVRPQPAAGHHRVDFETGPDSAAGRTGFDAVGSWQSAGAGEPLRWELRPRLAEGSAVVRYALQPGAGKLELSAGIELHSAADRELRDLNIQLPEGSTVQGVNGDRLADWWQEGTALHVRFAQPGAVPGGIGQGGDSQTAGDPQQRGGGGGNGQGEDGITRLALNLTVPVAAGAGDFVFRPLVIGGFSKVSGSGLLIAPLNQETSLALTPAAPALRETAPELAVGGFTIRPPFEAKRGFVFEGQDWTAAATLKPMAARFDVDWVLDAELRDSWVELNTRVLLAVTRGGLERIEFTTPASAPEYRVTGEGLRETVSAVEGAVRRYTVSFQALRTGAVLFTLTGWMPLDAAGGADLPDLNFADAARLSRFVIVDNKSAGEMALRPSGMDLTPREQVSLLPSELVSGQTAARFYRARPGWSMRVTGEKLETSAGQAAVVLQADLTTSLLRNGDVWQRAVYVLANRSLQFLPVRLPEGAEVISVSVGGESTRADSGVADGQPVLLVPLIQTAPGELAMEVRLIYRLRGKGGSGFTGVLDDPELPGLSIGQTFWTVEYPDGFSLSADGGNMTPIGDGQQLAGGKAESRLAELSSLRSIAASDNYDQATRERARYNVRKLAGDLQKFLPSGSERGEGPPEILTDEDRKPIAAADGDRDLDRKGNKDSGRPSSGPELAGDRRVKEFVANKSVEAPASQAAAPASASRNARVDAAGTEENLLNLNDNVSWSFRNGATNSKRDADGNVLSDKDPFAAAKPEAAPSSTTPRRRALQIDRLQSLGGGTDGGVAKPAEGLATVERFSRAENEQDSGYATGKIELNYSRTRMTADQKQQEFTDLNRNYSFGNARLNNVQQAPSPEKAADSDAAKKKDAKSEPALEQKGQLPPVPQQPQTVTANKSEDYAFETATPDRRQAGAAIATAALADAAGAKRELGSGADGASAPGSAGIEGGGPSRLRTSGRVSLDAVFPSQSQALHFRKMKGGAMLQLKLSDPVSHGINWGGALALSFVLGLMFWFRFLNRKHS